MIGGRPQPHLILHLNISNPAHYRRANSWACLGREPLFFKRSTVWGPKPGHSNGEIDALVAEYRGIGDDILLRALRNPVVSDAPDAVLNVDWLNEQERNRARLGQSLFESANPVGESFCVLIDPNEIASYGQHQFAFPSGIHLEVLNVESLENFASLNQRIWDWLDVAADDLRTQEWSLLERDPVAQGWSWFGSWRQFLKEQSDLKSLIRSQREDDWNPGSTELLTQKLRHAQPAVTDRFRWEERHWGRDRAFWNDSEIQERDRWTGAVRPDAWPSSQADRYSFVPVETVVLHGVWALVFWQVQRDLRNQEVAASCPDCLRAFPFERGRHKDRLCDECKAVRNRKRKASWARNNRKGRGAETEPPS